MTGIKKKRCDECSCPNCCELTGWKAEARRIDERDRQSMQLFYASLLGIFIGVNLFGEKD